MKKIQMERDRTQEEAWACAEGGAAAVPAPADHVSAQIMVKQYLTDWEFPAMSSAVLNVETPWHGNKYDCYDE